MIVCDSTYELAHPFLPDSTFPKGKTLDPTRSRDIVLKVIKLVHQYILIGNKHFQIGGWFRLKQKAELPTSDLVVGDVKVV